MNSSPISPKSARCTSSPALPCFAIAGRTSRSPKSLANLAWTVLWKALSFAPGAKSASRRSSFRRPRTSTYGPRNMIATRRTSWHCKPKSLAASRKAFTSALLLGNNPNSLAHPPLIPPSRSRTGKAFISSTKRLFPISNTPTKYFQQMLQKDPLSARAWTGVAMAAHHSGMWGAFDEFPRAKTAALKAISLDDSLAEAHAELGMLSYVYDWNIAEAERELRRAVDLNPNYARTHVYYALMLSHIGRSQEGIEEIERARRLDPLSPFTVGIAGNVYFAVRKYDDAVRALQFALQIEPQDQMAHARMAWIWQEKAEYEKAIEELRLSSSPESRDSPDGKKTFHRLADAYAARGANGYWREMLALALERYKPGAHYGTEDIAALYSRLGEEDKALDWLEKGYAVHDPYMMFGMVTSSAYDPLRSHPRFQKLLRELNLSAHS